MNFVSSSIGSLLTEKEIFVNQFSWDNYASISIQITNAELIKRGEHIQFTIFLSANHVFNTRHINSKKKIQYEYDNVLRD